MPNISIARQTARSNNEKWYETGKPCKNGHNVPRRTSTGMCQECEKIFRRKSAIKHAEAIRERNRDFYRKHPTRGLEKRRIRHLKKFGLTQQTFNDMLTAQNNSCAICDEVFSKTPHVDHDHVTGKVRGLLCSLCNTGIGALKDSPEVLLKAISYLTCSS